MADPRVHIRLLTGFDDHAICPESWNTLVRTGNSDSVFLTYQYQKVWWEVFGRGKLLLIGAFTEGRLTALAPLFTDSDMIFFVGSGGSDYLDFIGDVSATHLLADMLQFAEEQVPGFLGFRLYHVPQQSQSISQMLLIQKWELFNEGGMPAPYLSIHEFPEIAIAATRKKSLLRHQSWFERNGVLETFHWKHAADILPRLDLFFEQHIARWEETGYPSLFLEPAQKAFYRRLAESLSETGWLRFSEIRWNRKAVAFHFGFIFQGRFLWYKPSFDKSLSRQSPGEVLLRQLLLHSLDETAHIFDFGLGDEPFKQRFATGKEMVETFGLYPKQALNKNYEK